MAPASPFPARHPLSASEACVPLPSRPPPCLRLPTPAGDPPPRSPLSKKSSPSTLSSASMLGSTLAAAPLDSSAPAPQRISSPRYELAAIAFLSTGPLRPKAGSRLLISPPKHPHAIRRPSSPLPCRTAARISSARNPGAKFTPRNVPPSTHNPCSGSGQSNRSLMTRWSPPVASPVPRKSGSSLPPPRLTNPNPTILHTCEQEGDSSQRQAHTLPSHFSPSHRERLAAYAFKIVDAPLTGTSEGGAGGGGHCLQAGLLGSSCTQQNQDPRAKLSFFSSSTEEWNSRVCSATPGAYAEPFSARLLREEEKCGVLQRTSAGEAPEGLLAKRALEKKTRNLCHWTLRQRPASQTSSACWHEESGVELNLPLRIANDSAREAAQPPTATSFSAKTCFSQPHVDSTDPWIQQRQRTYCIGCTECAIHEERGLVKSAEGMSLLAPLSEPNRLLSHRGGHPEIDRVEQTCRRHFLGEKGTDADAQYNVTEMVHGICRPPSCSALQTLNDLDSPLRHSDPPSLPSLETHSSRGQDVGAPLPDTEKVRRFGAVHPLVPQMTHPNEAKDQPYTAPPATLHRKHSSAEPFRTELVTNRLVSAAAQTSVAGGLEHAACHETDKDSGESLTTQQSRCMTTLAEIGSVTHGERITLADVGAHAAGASIGTQADVDAFLTSVSNSDVVRNRPQGICTRLSTGAQQVSLGEEKGPGGLHEYCDRTKDEEECHFVTAESALIRECSTELPRSFLERKLSGGDRTEEAVVAALTAANSEEAALFVELQHTLRELQAHRMALRASDIIFDTTECQELLPLQKPHGWTTQKSGNFGKTEKPLLAAPVSCVKHALQYCVLEEGSFGKVFVGRFLGRLPTAGGRRWWRTLPLCECFPQGASCALPYPATGFLPPQVQEAMENNVKVAIKVPVEAMMLRDPLGTLARTLNEWKILALVHEKRKMLFSRDSGREDGAEGFDSVADAGTPRSRNAAARKKAFNQSNYGGAGEAVPSVFCQDQVSAERISSLAFERWHPMHPQAEPPGVVELVGGVVQGPLDVWLVTRLAAGKDLHTRKYTRCLADGISIPPAAALAMCRQLAAIVDFLHARTRQSVRRSCAALAAAHGHQSDDTAVPDNCRELQPSRDFCSRVDEAPVIVHRDIKPENIIVDDNWRIQLCDFGDAEASPDGVVSRVSGATWLYAPAELLCAAPLKTGADERGVKCENLFQRKCGRRLVAPAPCIPARGTRYGSRSRSCPTLADMQKQWLEGSVCRSAECAGEHVSSSRRVDTVFTEKWDIWSMGCVFQEMFGLPSPMSPYVAPTDPPHVVYEKLKSRACSGQLVPVVAPEIQGIARQIIFACLRSDPQARPSATAVLRMWSAPEKEILKDIRLPFPLPTPIHDAPYARSAMVAAWKSATPEEFCIRHPATGMRRTLMLGREQYKQTRGGRRNVYKSARTPCSPERKYRCAERAGSGTATGRKLNSQDKVYVVPNLAIVSDHYNAGVTCTGLAA